MTMIFFIFTDPPKSVHLLGNRTQQFSAGRMEKLECTCYGSQPAPKFRWYVGNRELQIGDNGSKDKTVFAKTDDNFVAGSFAQEERKEFIKGEEVAITTGSIRFIPSIEDNGKYISCRVTNTYFPEITKEDGYIITVNCKFFFHAFQKLQYVQFYETMISNSNQNV